MVSRFTLLAPWWARWLANAAASSATLAVVAAAVFPRFPTAAAWPWNAVAVVAAGFATTIGIVATQQPMRRAYTAALAGLDRPQQNLALAALRRNDIPPDPAVLAAAIRAADLQTDSIKRVTTSQKAVRWWLPPLYALMAVLQFFEHQPRMGFFSLGFALYLGAYFAILTYRAKRLPARVAQLRAATATIPEAEAALTDTAGAVPRFPRRLWVTWILIAALVACYFLAQHFWGSPSNHHGLRHDRCVNVDSALAFVNQHPDMLQPQQLPTGDPTLSAYRDWSDQLHLLAQQERDPELARRLNTVDSLAAHAVAVVRDLRTHAGPASPAEVISAHETDYQTTLSAINDQLRAATSECSPRH